jgi:DNA replication protein
MRTFSGFAPGRVRAVRLPETLFSDLVPMIDDLNELKATLHVFYKLEGQQGEVRYVLHRDLLDDPVLVESMEPPTPAMVEAALERAVERGSLLRAELSEAGVVYFANTPRGRAMQAALRRGEPLTAAQPESRPTIFALYEENIGPLAPLLAEELQEAESTYPADWIEGAFREAVALNKRSWRYIRAILERWQNEGRQDVQDSRERPRDGRRYIEGKYGEYIEH